jgi:hypothetical protein
MSLVAPMMIHEEEEEEQKRRDALPEVAATLTLNWKQSKEGPTKPKKSGLISLGS